MVEPAAVLELAYRAPSKGAVRKGMWVRIPPAAWRRAPSRDNPPPVELAERMELVRELCSFEGRLAGTDAERRAAARLARRLERQGWRPEIEPTYVHPQWPLVHALHCALGFGASLLALVAPAAGFAIALAAAVSMYLDLNGRAYVLRPLFFRRASQNVVARRPGDEGGRATVYVCAHYDAARTGAAYAPRQLARLAALARLTRLPLSPARLAFWSLAALLPLLGLRMAGLGGALLSLLQLPPTLALLLATFALVDIELSDVVPGANDNASGVATALALAAAVAADPPRHLDVRLVLTGGEGPLVEGLRSFLRAHRRELDPRRSVFLNLDAVGRGELRYLASEGLAVSQPADRRLRQLCEAIAEASGAEGGAGAARGPDPHAFGFATDAALASARGYPAITITALEPGTLAPPGFRLASDAPELLEPEAMERALAFALALVRQLDRDVERRSRLATAGAA